MFWQRLLLRPDHVECVPVVDLTVLDHVLDRVGVLDVVERVAMQYEDVGELADLDRADVLLQPDGLEAQGTRSLLSSPLLALARRWRSGAGRVGPVQIGEPSPALGAAVAVHIFTHDGTKWSAPQRTSSI